MDQNWAPEPKTSSHERKNAEQNKLEQKTHKPQKAVLDEPRRRQMRATAVTH